MKKFWMVSLSTLLLGSGAVLEAAAQEENIEIDKMTCGEMLKMGGNERDFTMIFMHGFVSGRQNDLIFDGAALTAATDKVLDGCIAEPDASLLSVFEKARS